MDESFFPVWDQDPPYPVIKGTETASERRFTARLVEVLHGRNLRLQRSHDGAREEYYSSGLGRLEDYWDELHDTLSTEVGGWSKLVQFIPEYELTAEPRALEMARHRLQWRARRALGLYRRLEMLC